ncbi:hypothetical protein QYE76_037132 [Lolium multiflorum]|uniref:DUF7788 domain-containing protein n=1 Tax=Lolium multiflorum TaxID=4521 RepID=A0AAD8VNQ8_LOLMU|nr:hypothetical protein QYE76_037132 [Lolium multiflorum]
MDWNMNTDFQAVFDKLVQVAFAGNLPPERMVKKVFVFSDMDFDLASSRPWETDYKAITRNGFSKNMLKIFLGGEEEAIPEEEEEEEEEEATPFPGEEEAIPRKKAAIPSILTPRDIMEKAISGP